MPDQTFTQPEEKILPVQHHISRTYITGALGTTVATGTCGLLWFVYGLSGPAGWAAAPTALAIGALGYSLYKDWKQPKDKPYNAMQMAFIATKCLALISLIALEAVLIGLAAGALALASVVLAKAALICVALATAACFFMALMSYTTLRNILNSCDVKNSSTTQKIGGALIAITCIAAIGFIIANPVTQIALAIALVSATVGFLALGVASLWNYKKISKIPMEENFANGRSLENGKRLTLTTAVVALGMAGVFGTLASMTLAGSMTTAFGATAVGATAIIGASIATAGLAILAIAAIAVIYSVSQYITRQRRKSENGESLLASSSALYSQQSGSEEEHDDSEAYTTESQGPSYSHSDGCDT